MVVCTSVHRNHGKSSKAAEWTGSPLEAVSCGARGAAWVSERVEDPQEAVNSCHVPPTASPFPVDCGARPGISQGAWSRPAVPRPRPPSAPRVSRPGRAPRGAFPRGREQWDGEDARTRVSRLLSLGVRFAAQVWAQQSAVPPAAFWITPDASPKGPRGQRGLLSSEPRGTVPAPQRKRERAGPGSGVHQWGCGQSLPSPGLPGHDRSAAAAPGLPAGANAGAGLQGAGARGDLPGGPRPHFQPGAGRLPALPAAAKMQLVALALILTRHRCKVTRNRAWPWYRVPSFTAESQYHRFRVCGTVPRLPPVRCWPRGGQAGGAAPTEPQSPRWKSHAGLPSLPRPPVLVSGLLVTPRTEGGRGVAGWRRASPAWASLEQETGQSRCVGRTGRWDTLLSLGTPHGTRQPAGPGARSHTLPHAPTRPGTHAEARVTEGRETPCVCSVQGVPPRPPPHDAVPSCMRLSTRVVTVNKPHRNTPAHMCVLFICSPAEKSRAVSSVRDGEITKNGN